MTGCLLSGSGGPLHQISFGLVAELECAIASGEKGAAADNLRKFDYINFGAGDACDLLISEKGAVPI